MPLPDPIITYASTSMGTLYSNAATLWTNILRLKDVYEYTSTPIPTPYEFKYQQYDGAIGGTLLSQIVFIVTDSINLGTMQTDKQMAIAETNTLFSLYGGCSTYCNGFRLVYKPVLGERD